MEIRCCQPWRDYHDRCGVTLLVGGNGGRRIELAEGGHGHCPDCGTRFTLREDGEVEVGPSVKKLLVALYREMNRHRCETVPEHIAATVLRSYGLADTYDEAAALWARMEEAGA